jgi:hypothetical protein
MSHLRSLYVRTPEYAKATLLVTNSKHYCYIAYMDKKCNVLRTGNELGYTEQYTYVQIKHVMSIQLVMTSIGKCEIDE